MPRDKRIYSTGLGVNSKLRQGTGIIKSWFNGDGAYGFIHPDDGGQAVFVHHSALAIDNKEKALRKGARVSYEVVQSKLGGLWAKNVWTTS